MTEIPCLISWNFALFRAIFLLFMSLCRIMIVSIKQFISLIGIFINFKKGNIMKQSKKVTVAKAVKAVYVLPLDAQSFINTEIMPELQGMNNAVIKKDEFLLSTSELVAELFTTAKQDKNFTVQFWNGTFSFIESRAVTLYKIADSTAKNYSKDIVAFLKLRNPAILKPASENKDAKRKASKKSADVKIIKKYSKVATETLADNLKDLIVKTDDISTAKVKEITSVIKTRNDTLAQASKAQASKAQKDFKVKYFKDLKDIFNNEYELAQFIHANIEKSRKDLASKK